MPLFSFAKKEDEKPVSNSNLTVEVLSTKTSYYLDSLIEKYNPNVFMSRKGFDTIDKMLNDEQIFGILELRKNLIVSTGYHFESENEDDQKENEILEFLETNFDKFYNGLFQKDLMGLMSAYEYGFSVSEKIYKKIGSNIYLTKVKTVPPHSIEFETDNNGNLLNVIQKQTTDIKIPEDKIVLFIHNEKFNLPYGQTDLRRCYELWFAKSLFIKLWAVYLQRFASPFPVVKVDDSFGSDKVAELQRILNGIQQTTSIILPKSADMELHKADNSSGEYDKAIEKMNQLIGRALLLPDLMGFGQSTGGGSYSLGEKQYDLFMHFINNQRLLIEELINEQIIKQLVEINFGKQETYPKFRFNSFGDDSEVDKIKMFIYAVRNNMPVTAQDWNDLREKLGFNDLSEALADKVDSEALIPKQEIKPIKGTADKTDPVEASLGLKFAEKQEVIKPMRKPSKYEARFDYVQQDKDLQSIVDKTSNRLADILKEAREALKEDILKKQIMTKGDIDASRKLQLDSKGAMKRALQSGLLDVYKYGYSDARQQILKLQEKQKNFARINDLQVPLEEATALAQELINNQSFQAIGQLSDDILNQAKQVMISGIQQGKSENWLVMELNGLFAPYTNGVVMAGGAFSPYLVNTIVRTLSTNIFNQARKDVANDPKLEGFVKMYEYSAIMDARTTEVCTMLDGKIYPIESPVWVNITPPNHFNCRSVLVYVTEADIAIDGVQPSEMISLDKLKEDKSTEGFIL